MPRYHLNKQGNPGTCEATIKCPFGDINDEHWSSKEEARAAYEERSSQGTMPKVKRSKAALSKVVRENKKVIGDLRGKESRKQSEKVKLEKVVNGLKAGSAGLDALMKLSKGDGDKVARLRDMAKVTRDEYDQAQVRLSEIDAERAQISKALNAASAKREEASRELARNYPNPKTTPPTPPTPPAAPRSNTSGQSYRSKGK